MKLSSIFSICLASITVDVGASSIPLDSGIKKIPNDSNITAVELYDENLLDKAQQPPVEETDTFKQFNKAQRREEGPVLRLHHQMDL